MSNIIHHCRLLFRAISYNCLLMVPLISLLVFNLLLLFLIFSLCIFCFPLVRSFTRFLPLILCAVFYVCCVLQHGAAAVGCICVNISNSITISLFFSRTCYRTVCILHYSSWMCWIGAPNFPFYTNKDDEEEEKKNEFLGRQKQQRKIIGESVLRLFLHLI